MIKDTFQAHINRIKSVVSATGELRLMTPFVTQESADVCKAVMDTLNKVALAEGFAHYAYVSKFCGTALTLRFIEIVEKEAEYV